MKTLFIATRHLTFCGGEVCTLRNLSMLKQTFGEKQVEEIRIERNNQLKKKHKLLWYAAGLMNDLCMCSISGIDRKQRQDIHNIIRQKQIEFVFLDSSLLGLLAKEIHQCYPNIKIATFFHNVEYLYYQRELQLNKKKALYYRLPIIRKNEMAACLYSDLLITLNERDTEQIKHLYGRDADITIPITLEDRYTNGTQKTGKELNDTPNMLFVGSNFSMNKEGILHFIKNILPFTNAQLTIVGSGMSQLLPASEHHDQIKIWDYVPDLRKFYEEASFVVIPIYSGSGMKVKTAEALMYGKYVIGTPEAFTGYHITTENGIQCNNDKEFIEAINQCTFRGFNPASRDLFLKEYHNGKALKQFQTLASLLEQ